MKQQRLSVPWQRPASPTPWWHRGRGAGRGCWLAPLPPRPGRGSSALPPAQGPSSPSGTRACPKGRLRDQHGSRGKLVVAPASPICYSAAQQEGLGREQNEGCIWAHFWLFKGAQALPFRGLITNNSVPCSALGTQNWL